MHTTTATAAPPPPLAAALTELHRRLDVVASAGVRTGFDGPPSIVVVNDAPRGLQDPAVLTAVERLARLGRKANMSVELRGTILPHGTDLRTACGGLALADVGGSQLLHRMILDPSYPYVYYRCLRHMRSVSFVDLVPGVTRIVVNDPQRLERGRPDSGVFVKFLTDRSWVHVMFPGGPGEDDQEEFLLVSDCLVEIEPATIIG